VTGVQTCALPILLFTIRGAPLVYYGDEWGAPGAGDPDNRRFMPWNNYSSDQQYLHDRIKTLLAIRTAHPALRRGLRSTISSSTDLWVFSMKTLGDEIYVAINRGDSDQTASGLPSQTLNELVTQMMVTGPNATIPARQTRIFTK